MPHLSSCCGTEAVGARHRGLRTCPTIRARGRYFAGSSERRTTECLGGAPAQRREPRRHAACSEGSIRPDDAAEGLAATAIATLGRHSADARATCSRAHVTSDPPKSSSPVASRAKRARRRQARGWRRAARRPAPPRPNGCGVASRCWQSGRSRLARASRTLRSPTRSPTGRWSSSA